MATKLRVSEQEYLDCLTGESPSYEFVNGEVFQKPLTRSQHVLVAKAAGQAFPRYEASAGGFFGWEVTTNLSQGRDTRYRVPDSAYWASGRPRGGDVFLPPTLAIEIISPGQSMDTLRKKCREYRSHGVDVAWLINPEQRIVEVFEADRDGDVLQGDAVLASVYLPGFELTLRGLFASLD
jgi:Uma2 family endonuclease